MKILTIGLSPYLMNSRAKIHSLVLKFLYFKRQEVISMSWFHDTSLFIPDDVNGQQIYNYKFNVEQTEYKIPLMPFHKDGNESVFIYEAINTINPDVVLTIGDFNDFLFMKAVKMFVPEIKWFFILTSYADSINPSCEDLLQYADGVLCTNEYAHNLFKDSFQKENMDYCYVGSSPKSNISNKDLSKNDKFRIISCGKTSQTDNLASLIESVSNVRTQIPNIELYLHSNIYDAGDYDLNHLKAKYDPNDEFIQFPDKYVSLTEGVSDEELCKQYNLSDLFINVSMQSATAIHAFNAASAGCIPLLASSPINDNFAEIFAKYAQNLTKEDFLIPSIKLLTGNGSNLYISDHVSISKKIIEIYERTKMNKGCQEKLAELGNEYNFKSFMDKMFIMLNKMKIENTIGLDSITGD